MASMPLIRTAFLQAARRARKTGVLFSGNLVGDRPRPSQSSSQGWRSILSPCDENLSSVRCNRMPRLASPRAADPAPHASRARQIRRPRARDLRVLQRAARPAHRSRRSPTRLGYPQSSTTVLLKSLIVLGYLNYDRKARTYVPSLKLASIGGWIADHVVPRGSDPRPDERTAGAHRRDHRPRGAERHLRAVPERSSTPIT